MTISASFPKWWILLILLLTSNTRNFFETFSFRASRHALKSCWSETFISGVFCCLAPIYLGGRDSWSECCMIIGNFTPNGPETWRWSSIFLGDRKKCKILFFFKNLFNTTQLRVLTDRIDSGALKIFLVMLYPPKIFGFAEISWWSDPIILLNTVLRFSVCSGCLEWFLEFCYQFCLTEPSIGWY